MTSVLLSMRWAVIAAVLVIFALPSAVQAELKIDITRGNVEPLPIAIVNFQGDVEEAARIGADMTSVISADLERSGLFRVIPESAFIQRDLNAAAQPRFADWRLINAEALVVGAVRLLVDGRLRVEFRLWDTFAGLQLVGKAFETPPENWRRVSHIVADEIYKRLTGEDGYFDTRIVYVSESGPQDARVKRLAIMDQDGANHRYLTNGRNLVLTPRFSPTTQEITYMSYVDDRPRVYLFNIDTGQQEVLGDFPGMTFAPRFSADGNKVILSMATGGNSDIFSMDLRTRQVQRLTNNPAIDTSPTYSPDGAQVAFNSDRGGSPQIYVMASDGGNVRRITFGRGRYLTPVWSPRGDLIAFTKIQQGRFFIGVVRPDGTGERLLAEDFLVESPTWAPNGRVLMFFRQQPSGPQGTGGGSRLYSIDLTGYNERAVETPMDASDPAWSPLIP